MSEEKSAEEIARERGDFIDEDEEVVAADADDGDSEEPEAEEIEAAAEEEDQPGDEAPEESPITIPKARFDEAQRKARERQEDLERRIKEMEASQKKEAETEDLSKIQTEIDELTGKYEDLLMDGELDKAREIRKQRDQKQNALFDQRLAQTSQQTSAAAVEQMRFDAQLAQFEVKYPAINPDSDSFNQDLANEVAEVLNAFQARGYTPAAALNKAMHYVIREDEPVAGEDPDIIRSKRGQQARKRVAKAAKSSPPDIADKGRDSDKSGSDDGLPDVTKMSPEQFDKLSEAELRALRGDSLADEDAA